MMVTQPCEYTKPHPTVYFKAVNFIISELHLNFLKFYKKNNWASARWYTTTKLI